jgi:hypothetical protein
MALAVRTRKSNTKPSPALSVALATRQARRHVDAIMPGVMATVESRLSHDLDTDTPTVVTTVTFPRMHPAISELRLALTGLRGQRDTRTDADRITITRTR